MVSHKVDGGRTASVLARGWLPGALVLGLCVLLEQLRWGGPIMGLDRAVYRWEVVRQDGVTAHVAQLITEAANPPLVVCLLLLGVAVLGGRRRSWWPPMLGLIASSLLVVVVLTLKYAVARPGPTGGAGVYWPSGHTTSAVVVCGVVAHLISTRWRRTRAVVAVGGPALVGVSLVLRNYHWLSDVVAGWLLGPLLLMAAHALARWVARTHCARRAERAIPAQG